MLNSIRATRVAGYLEVVRYLEGPLWEAQLYIYIYIYMFICKELIEETGRPPRLIFGLAEISSLKSFRQL